METGYARLTVCFEDPFWICLYERGGGGTYECCKLTFGAEPGDQEVYAFLMENWRRLEFGPSLEDPPERKPHPKRARREARKAVRPGGLGTKAQQALALQREEGKAARARRRREDREAEQDRKYALRQEKRKEKHRGR